MTRIFFCGLIGAALAAQMQPHFVPARTLSGHTGYVNAIAFTPDGKRLATGSWDGTVKFWEVASGEQLFTLNGHPRPITSIAISPDGRTLVSGSDDHTLKVWDIAARREVKTLIGHNSFVLSLAYSPDGKVLASASAYGAIRLWDTATWKQLRRIEAHPISIQYIGYSPDGRLLVTAGREGSIKIWNPATGELIRTITEGFIQHNRPVGLGFSPDGKRMASISSGGDVGVYDVAEGKRIALMKSTSGKPYSGSALFGPDGTWLVSGAGGPGEVRLWSAGTWKLISKLEGQIAGGVEAIALSPDGHWLAACGDDDTARLWHWESK